MKRQDIQIGEDYLVAASLGKRGREQDRVARATVLEFDAEYQSFQRFAYQTFHDGIRVRFQEPMVVALGSGILKPIDYAAGVDGPKGDLEAVIPGVRYVLKPWAEHEKDQREEDEMHARWKREADEEGDEFEPRLAAVKEKLASLGVEAGISAYRREGTEGFRMTRPKAVHIDFDELEKLLAQVPS